MTASIGQSLESTKVQILANETISQKQGHKADLSNHLQECQVKGRKFFLAFCEVLRMRRSQVKNNLTLWLLPTTHSLHVNSRPRKVKFILTRARFVRFFAILVKGDNIRD